MFGSTDCTQTTWRQPEASCTLSWAYSSVWWAHRRVRRRRRAGWISSYSQTTRHWCIVCWATLPLLASIGYSILLIIAWRRWLLKINIRLGYRLLKVSTIASDVWYFEYHSHYTITVAGCHRPSAYSMIHSVTQSKFSFNKKTCTYQSTHAYTIYSTIHCNSLLTQ